MIYKQKGKYYVWQRLLTPFILLIDSLINILLLPTPFISHIHTIWLKRVLKIQMKKRIDESK